MTRAVLLSGGMDSIALAYWKRPTFAFTIDYGQVCAAAEIRAAQVVTGTLGIQHEVIRADCAHLGSGDLAGTPASAHAPVPEWWPFRNQLLVTFAAMRAVAVGVNELLIGTLVTDCVHHDGTPEFVDLMGRLTSMQEGNVRVTAPAIHMSAIELSRASGVPIEILAWAHSCHRADYACGDCRGCNKHRETMSALGFGDY